MVFDLAGCLAAGREDPTVATERVDAARPPRPVPGAACFCTGPVAGLETVAALWVGALAGAFAAGGPNRVLGFPGR